MSAIRKAATSIEEVDAVVKRRRLDNKTDVAVVDTTPRITNEMFHGWLLRLRGLHKRPANDCAAQVTAIDLNEEVKTYASALVADDILIPEDCVPCLFGLPGIDELAKLFVRCDGQYYHDCSIAMPQGKTIVVKQGVINCSHLMHDEFGMSGQKWSLLAVYQLKQLTQARHEARGKSLNAAVIDLRMDGFTSDIVNIVQSYFPVGFAHSSLDFPVGFAHSSLDFDSAFLWGMYPTQNDPFFANRIVTNHATREPALVRARIPWIWNHKDVTVHGHDADDETYGYPATPESPTDFNPTSPSYSPTSPSYSPTSMSSSAAAKPRVKAWESTTIMIEPTTDAPA